VEEPAECISALIFAGTPKADRVLSLWHPLYAGASAGRARWFPLRARARILPVPGRHETESELAEACDERTGVFGAVCGG